MKGRRHNILIISLKKKKKNVFKDNRQSDSDKKGDGLSSILAYDPIMLGGGEKEAGWREGMWKPMAQDSHTWGQVEPDHKSLELLVPLSAPLICIPITHAFQLVWLLPLARLHLILL